MPPQWLSDAIANAQNTFPNHMLQAIPRATEAQNGSGWRMQCFDCPGKLYITGPGETLANFEAHLRNRHHLQKVNARVGAVPADDYPSYSSLVWTES